MRKTKHKYSFIENNIVQISFSHAVFQPYKSLLASSLAKGKTASDKIVKFSDTDVKLDIVTCIYTVKK